MYSIWALLPITTRPYQPHTVLNSIFPQTEVKYRPASLGMVPAQHEENPIRCRNTRRLTLQIINYPYSSRCWVDTAPSCWESNTGPLFARQWLWITASGYFLYYEYQTLWINSRNHLYFSYEQMCFQQENCFVCQYYMLSSNVFHLFHTPFIHIFFYSLLFSYVLFYLV